MAHRGGLIFPVWACIVRVDRDAMRNQPVGADEDPRYNDTFREPRLLDTPDGVGRIDRRETEPVQIRCQVEARQQETLRMLAAGNAPASSISIVVHRKDAEDLKLLDANGRPIFDDGDRLVAFKKVSLRGTPGDTIESFDKIPGLYLVESTPAGTGFNLVGASFNLQVLRFEDRRTSPQRFE